jgi:hypothetical protein
MINGIIGAAVLLVVALLGLFVGAVFGWAKGYNAGLTESTQMCIERMRATGIKNPAIVLHKGGKILLARLDEL